MFANNCYSQIPGLTEHCRKHLLGSVWEDELDSDDERDMIDFEAVLCCNPERLGAKTWVDHLYDGNTLCDEIPEHETFRKQFIRANGYLMIEELEEDCRQITMDLFDKYPAFVGDLSREAVFSDGTLSWLDGLLEGDLWGDL